MGDAAGTPHPIQERLEVGEEAAGAGPGEAEVNPLHQGIDGRIPQGGDVGVHHLGRWAHPVVNPAVRGFQRRGRQRPTPESPEEHEAQDG
jgi:hypothetical protein